ncbi:HEAT repeat-containing protein 1 isoform X1 [Hydra vulgaris]|uniref:HEAT repeat-containing protein 1 isoform X1 n=1 Tax=Hydra vulgaris TaxID=6087 RepID=UPI001F5EC7DB|nr:HEAT repeat-containing protein 1 isoform X1 [Hydra vulgaris]
MSLSDQLKSLQIPGQAAIQQNLSIKHSILFDAQTSATLDNDTILEIGITGFTNLCSIDFVFKQFEDLFTRSALKIQRNMENKDFNRRLSKKLSMFLMFLSPYVLLKPAHRVLEWLVRRFQIHIHEKNALIGCLLPYHETQFFGRVVQLFGELENDQLWFFLQPFKQSGTGFSTNTLVQHCIKNEGMLRFVHDMTMQSAELLKYSPKSGFRIIFSFHARLFISVIDSKSAIKNKFLSFILTIVTSSLKVHHKDLVCSLYMIVGLISSKVNLARDVTKSLLQAIFQSLETEWYEEGLLCVLSVVVHQKLEKISSRITKLFVNLDLTKLMQVLNYLNKEHDIEVLINLLVSCICKSCFSSNGDEERFIKALHLMIDNEILIEKHVKIVARKFISALLLSEDQVKDFQKTESLLRIFAKRFSAVFDETIALFFKESSGNQKSIDILKQLSIICLSSSHRKVAQGAELPIILGLNHPEPNIRIDAVHHLLKGFESIDYDDNEMEFMKDAILARLKDDSIDVVNSVLNYSKSLSKILSAKDLQELSISLMSKTGSYFEEEIIIYTLEALDGNLSESKFVYTFLLHIFDMLVEIKSTKILDYFKTMNINLGHPILIGIQKALASIDLKKPNKKISVLAYHSLLSNVAQEISKDPSGLNVILNFWEFCKELPSDHHLQLVVILLFNEVVLIKSPFLEGFVNEVIQMNFKNFFQMGLSEELLYSMEGFKNTEKEKNYLYKSFYAHLKQNEFENDSVLLAFLVFFKNLTTVTPKGHNTEVLFNILATQSGNKRASLKKFFQMLLSHFLKEKFNTKNDLLSFLCSVSLNAMKDNIQEEKLKSAICALQILNVILTKKDYELVEKNNIAQVSHALFLCKHQKIRETVLQLNKVLYEIFKQEKKNPWNSIFLKVIESEKEVFMDSLYIKRIYQTLFNSKKVDDFASLIKRSSSKSTINFITKKLINYPVILQLNILKVLESVNPEDCIDDYVDVLTIIFQSEKLTDCQAEIVKIILNNVKPKLINEKKSIFDCFCKCLSSSNEVLQDMACGMLSETFYSELSPENRRLLLNELLRITLSTSSVTTATKMRIVLKSINIIATDINELLEKIYHDLEKMQNMTEESTDALTKSWFWRQLVELLESISCKNKIDQPEVLITPLFNIFNKCLVIKNASVEYVKQLLLTIFTYILNQGVLNISPDLFKIDLVIQCLQESKDFQTTRHCLVLLGKSAQHYPSQVLHNIMHIFTFMGGTMLKIDNQQTFRLIENTIDAIVPMLVQKSPEVTESRKRPSPTNIDVIILFILETFIDSAPHCPEHRRQHILSHLIKVLNEDRTLHTAMVLLIKKTIQIAQEVVVDDNFKEIQPASITLDFCKDFFMGYPSDVQLHSLCQIIAYLKEPNEEQVKKSKDGNKQVKILTYAVIKFVTEVLASATMQELYVVEESKYTPLVIKLLEELLSYVETLSIKNFENQKDKKYINNLTQKVYDAVGLLNKILPFDSFVAVVSGLINKESLLIRKKSLEMLCTKLSELETVPKNQEKPLLNLYSSIVVLVQHNSDNSPTNKQLMLYAMKLLAAHLCQKDKEIFLKSVPIVAQVYCLKETNNLVAVNAILCVAELSSHLKAAMLPYLPIFFKPILEKIKKEGDYQNSDLTLIGCTTAIQKIIASMPEFMSPFVPKILETISISGYLAEKLSCNQLMEKVNNLKENCGHLIPPRVLYPAVETWFHENLVSNKYLVSSIIDVLKHSFAVISKADANTNFQGTILKILKMLFDVHSFETDDIEIIIEKKSIAAYCELVLKLSENTLRPMYLEIYNWSCEEERRLCTFFHLNVELSKTLKSLFLIFFGHTYNKCTELLVTLNSKNIANTSDLKKKNDLIEAVLDVLSNVFKYDNQGFVNKERFESIMQPLVDQLDNSLFLDEAFTLFAEKHLLPCIVNFTCAVNDSSLWKPLNHQILLKTKSSQANVRLAALQIIENIYNRIGESYMILVPETIPFLAEVLEDDSFEVEAQCKKVIKQIELITGESLQKYF